MAISKTTRAVLVIAVITAGFYWLISHVECAQALETLSFNHILKMCR